MNHGIRCDTNHPTVSLLHVLWNFSVDSRKELKELHDRLDENLPVLVTTAQNHNIVLADLVNEKNIADAKAKNAGNDSARM
nr:hypothetical protein CFP56_74978 [Quercus suber]